MLFKDIIGHEEIKNRLRKSVLENRISHAQLFLGAEGSGNLQLAIAYAQYICCNKRTDDDSCGTCSSCIKYNKLIHPDLHFVFPVVTKKNYSMPDGSTRDLIFSSDYMFLFRKAFMENPHQNLNQWLAFIDAENKQGIIAVDESSELIKKLSLKTYESDYKIAIIWMPEKMRTEAANHLLKIIEEPPDKTLFLLVAENSDLIINTILSRTQLVKINKPADEELIAAIMAKYDYKKDQAAYIVHLADGNQNEVQSLAHPDADDDSTEELLKWWRLCYGYQAAKNQYELLAWVDVQSKIGREKQKNFILYAMHILRECLMLQYAGDSIVRMNEEELKAFTKFAPYITENNCYDFVNELNKAYFHIERNANPKILFLDLSFKLGKLLRNN
jgi:DNA polymerase-3 subunit delta'